MKDTYFHILIFLSFISCYSQKIDKERISGYVTKEGVISGDNTEKINKQIKEDAVFTRVTENASFPKGIKAFLDYFKKSYKTPPEIVAQNISGKIFLSFVVEKDGRLTNCKIIRDIGYNSGEEAIKTLQLGPKWIPAKYGEIYVRSLYNIPISINEKNK